MKAILLGTAAFLLVTASASAADLGVPPAPAAFAWTGCYAGGSVGGGWGQKDLTDSAGTLAGVGYTGPSSISLDISGYMLGGQIGCDYQFSSNWLLGVEGYVVGGKIGGDTTVPETSGHATFSDTTSFLTSGTARLGYAHNRWLPYVKGGVAWAGDNYSVTDASGLDEEGMEDRLGWTVGAGIEWALWNDWSVRLEYDYYGFGTQSVMFDDGPVEIKQDIQTIMLGLNFHVFAGEHFAQ